MHFSRRGQLRIFQSLIFHCEHGKKLNEIQSFDWNHFLSCMDILNEWRFPFLLVRWWKTVKRWCAHRCCPWSIILPKIWIKRFNSSNRNAPPSPKGTLQRGTIRLSDVHMVLLPVLSSMWDHLGKNNYGVDVFDENASIASFENISLVLTRAWNSSIGTIVGRE